MAIVKGKGRQSSAVSRESEGADVYLRALRDGSMIQADWKQAAIIGGYGYHVTVGSFSGAITGGGNGNILDTDEPEFVISVPNGTCILPLRVHIAVKPGAFNAEADETDIVLGVDQDALLVSGTATAEVAYNMNTLCGKTSACTCKSAFTASCTNPVLDLELSHAVVHTDQASTSVGTYLAMLELLYEPINPPIINGPAMLVGYWGGTVAATGFASISWLEFPETAFSV